MLMDIGAGLLIALGVSLGLEKETTLGFLTLGVLFTLLPDIDVFLPHFPGGRYIEKKIGSHRSILHHPLLYVPVIPFVFFFFGITIGVLFVFGLFFHFIHDTFFLGWGIKWLWPFSEMKLSLLHERNGRITKDVLFWTPENELEIKKKYANSHWIRDSYFRFNFISVTEYAVFVTGLVSVGFFLF